MTSDLWLSAVPLGLLTLGAVAAVSVPLLRRPVESAVRADYDLRVYRDQLDEMERDLDRGLITADQAEAARIEIQRRMLAADSEAQAARKAAAAGHPPGRRLRLALAITLGLAVPLGALTVYAVVGVPGLSDRPIAAREAERLGLSASELAAAKADLEAREAAVRATPDDQSAWIALAEARQALQRNREALAAWDEALKRGPVDADAWSLIGEANTLAHDGAVVEAAQVAFRNALRLQRADPRARWYLGLAESQGGRPLEAIAIWRDLARDTPPDAPWSRMLRARIGQLAQAEGVMPDGIAPRHPLDEPGTAHSGASAAVDEDTMIAGMVQRLKDRLTAQPDDFDGWMRLGRSLMVLGDTAGGAEAYGRAVALNPAHRDARFAYATALAASAARAGEAPPPAFFATVAALAAEDPEAEDALYLTGLAARLNGDTATARAQWTRLRDGLPAGSNARQAIEEQLSGLDGE